MNKILLFIKTPPPTTGATLMNKRVHDSGLIKKSFAIRSICISYMQNLNEMGKWNISKLFKIISVCKELLFELWFYQPVFVYFQLSPHGFAFFRDLFFVTIIKMYRVRILFHMRGKGIKHKSDLKKLFYRYCFKNEYVICLSSLLVNDIEDVYSGKIFTVPNGIPDLTTDSDTKKINSPIRILFLSNLIKSKGIFDFIEALQILNKKGYEFEGWIVGAEADLSADNLNTKLIDYGISDKVKYVGAKYGEEKNKIWTSCDILIFPTTNDIWGNVLLEAMQFSLPVIATNEGAIPEIIDDGVNGYVIDQKAPDRIARKLEILIRSPDMITKMGEAGRKKYIENYTIDKFENNMKNVFKNVIKEIIENRNV